MTTLRRQGGDRGTFPDVVEIPACLNCGNDGRVFRMELVILRRATDGLQISLAQCKLCTFRWRMPLTWMPFVTPRLLCLWWAYNFTNN